MRLKQEELLPARVRAYIQEHSIDEVISRALSEVLTVMPADPIGHVAHHLTAAAGEAPPRLSALRLSSSGLPEDLTFEIVVGSFGITVAVGAVSFASAFVRLEQPPLGGDGARPSSLAVAEERMREQEMREGFSNFLVDYFHRLFVGDSVDEFASFHSRCIGLLSGEVEVPVPARGAEIDRKRFVILLLDALLCTCARARGKSEIEFLQGLLGQHAKPPLRRPQDFPRWRSHWPLIALPLFFGGGPVGGACPLRATSLRVCVAFSPFVATSSAGFERPQGCPSPGWLLSTLRCARLAVEAGTKALQTDKDKAAAAMVSDGVVYCHPAGLMQTVKLAREAAQGASAGRPEETAGVLVAAADQVWNEAEQVYELETNKKLSLLDLVEYYALLLEDRWIRMIVRPFRVADMEKGCELLKSKRPDVCLLVEDPEATPIKGAACATVLEGSAAHLVEHHAKLSARWHAEGADGFGRFAYLGAQTARWMTSVFDVVLSCAGMEVVCLGQDVSADDLARASARLDGHLYAAMCAEEVDTDDNS